MIKKAVFLMVSCLFLSVGLVSAQRYLPGQQGLQVTGGMVDGKIQDYHVGIALSSYTKRGNRWVYGGEFLNKQTKYSTIKLPVSQFTGEAGYYFNILSDRRKIFFFSLGVSALAGYETVNWGEKLLYDGATIMERDRFLYGGALTFEIESYLTDRLVLLLNVRERILWGSDVDVFHNQIGIGFKYIIQ